MTKKFLYPVNLNISGKLCVVIGGGKVAERKVRGLLKCGANVKLIGREVLPSLLRLAQKGEIKVLARNYRGTDLKGAFLVMAATDDESINEKVAADSRRAGIIVNVADKPSLCDFTLPSIVRRGTLSIAISTDGSAPFLAKGMRKYIEKEIGREYTRYAKILSEVREKVIKNNLPQSAKKRIFNKVSDGTLLEMVKRKASLEEINKFLNKIGADFNHDNKIQKH